MRVLPGSSMAGPALAAPSRQVAGRPRRRDRRLLPGLGLLVMLGPAPASAADLPPDVVAFMARRDRCDHFRGEDATDAARRIAIDRALAANCRGTDAQRALLLRRHAGNPAVRDRLDGYDPDVEGSASRRR